MNQIEIVVEGAVGMEWKIEQQVAEAVDVPATVAQYVGERIEPGAYIYVANYQPVIYYISETRSPTRWAFPDP